MQKITKIVGVIILASMLLVGVAQAARVTPQLFNQNVNNVWLRNVDYNLALGTTSEETKLTVVGTTTAQDIVPNDDSLYDLGTTALRWENIWADSLTVGGTTTLANLVVTGTLYISGTIGGGDVNFDGHNLTNAGFVEADYFKATSTPATSTFAGAFTVGTNSFVVDQYDDMVGIGTTTAGNALTVIGDVSATGELTLDTDLNVTGTTTLGLDLIVDTDTFYVDTYGNLVGIGTSSPNALLAIYSLSTSTEMFKVGVTTTEDYFTIDGSGQVGIASSAPATVLVVTGTTTAQNIIPAADATYYLGNTGHRWNNIYSVTSTIGSSLILGTDVILGSDVLDIRGSGTSTWETTGGLTLQADGGNLTATSSDVLILGAGGAERMRILRTGLVGIGTTTPNSLLSIYSQATSTELFRVSASSSPTINDFFIIDGNGNVGIGTSTPQTLLSVGANNQFRIDSSGNIATDGTLDVAGDTTLAGATSTTHTVVTALQSIGTLIVEGLSTLSTLTFTAATSSDQLIVDNLSLNGNTINAMTGTGLFLYEDGGAGIFIEDGGNVGIASSSPATKFVVTGTTTAQNILPGKDNNYYLGSAGQRWANIYAVTTTIGTSIAIGTDTIIGTGVTDIRGGATSTWEMTTGGLTLQTSGDLVASSSNAFIASAGGTEALRILESGNVGIGTTTPGATLTVPGSVNFTDDAILEGDIAFSTACAAGNHYYLNGNDLACEADDDTTYTAGDHLTLTSTDFDLDTEIKTQAKCFAIEHATSTDKAFAHILFPSASTLTYVSCSVSAGATSTIQADERAEATPNTSGTDAFTSPIACDPNSATTTSFNNATMAARSLLSFDIDSSAGTPTSTRMCVEFTIDD